MPEALGVDRLAKCHLWPIFSPFHPSSPSATTIEVNYLCSFKESFIDGHKSSQMSASSSEGQHLAHHQVGALSAGECLNFCLGWCLKRVTTSPEEPPHSAATNGVEGMEITGVDVLHITRKSQNDPQLAYTLFYSQVFAGPPRECGVTGDFFITTGPIFFKDSRGRWKVAHFNGKTSHPSMPGFSLCFDKWGPKWTRSPLPPTTLHGLRPICVAWHFYSTLALHIRAQGMSASHPISLNAD